MPVSVATDPTSLDFPEQEFCHGLLPPAPDLTDGPERGGRSSVAPCAGLSIALHAGLVALALFLVLTTPAPRPPVLISLLPALQVPGGEENPEPAVVSVPAAAPSASPAPAVEAAPPVIRPALPSAPAVEKRQKPKSEVRAKRPDPVRITPRDAPKLVESAPVESAPLVSSAAASTAIAPVGRGSETLVEAVPPAPGSVSQGGVGAGSVQANFGEADGPRFVQRVLPKYPELARRKGREGLVVLRLTIGAGGELKDVSVVDGGGHGFEDAALAAIRASRYAPARRDGQCVECSALLPIRFALKDG